MPQLLHVESFIKESSDPRDDPEPGFRLRYKYNGISKRAVEGRAVGRLVSKYPLKANNIEVLDTQVVDRGGVSEFIVELFVPNKSLGDRATNIISDLTDRAGL